MSRKKVIKLGRTGLAIYSLLCCIQVGRGLQVGLHKRKMRNKLGNLNMKRLMKARTNNRSLVPALVAGFGLILAGPAYGSGSVWTWDGGGSDNLWTDSANWSPLGFPHTGDNVQFGGNVQLNPYNNNSGLVVSELVFNAGSGAFTLNGNAISVGGAGGIVNNSAATQTINMPVTLTAAEAFKPTSGPLVFSTIDGAHPLTFSGGFTVYLMDSVGAATPLISFAALTPVAVSGGSVHTTGAQTYELTLAYEGDTLLQSDSAGITVLGTVLGVGDNLTLISPATVALNSATGLGSLNVTANQTTLNGTFSSTGSQAYTVTGSGSVVLAGNTLLQSSSSAGTIALGTVAGNDYNLTITTPAAAFLNDATGIGTLNVTANSATLSGTISTTVGPALILRRHGRGGIGRQYVAAKHQQRRDHRPRDGRRQRLQPGDHHARCGLPE